MSNSLQPFLVLKETGEESLDFKKRIFGQIRQAKHPPEEVMLVGENEPENLTTRSALFPNAISIFVEGAILNQNARI